MSANIEGSVHHLIEQGNFIQACSMLISSHNNLLLSRNVTVFLKNDQSLLALDLAKAIGDISLQNQALGEVIDAYLVKKNVKDALCACKSFKDLSAQNSRLREVVGKCFEQKELSLIPTAIHTARDRELQHNFAIQAIKEHSKRNDVEAIREVVASIAKKPDWAIALEALLNNVPIDDETAEKAYRLFPHFRVSTEK